MAAFNLTFVTFDRNRIQLPDILARRCAFFALLISIMVALAQGLPVVFIPEQLPITTMRLDVVDDCCRHEAALAFAHCAQRMLGQVKLSRPFPFRGVAPIAR